MQPSSDIKLIKLKEIDTLEGLQSALKDTKAEIGESGGRKFKLSGCKDEYSMNDIVKQFTYILENKADLRYPNQKDLANELKGRLSQLNEQDVKNNLTGNQFTRKLREWNLNIRRSGKKEIDQLERNFVSLCQTNIERQNEVSIELKKNLQDSQAAAQNQYKESFDNIHDMVVVKIFVLDENTKKIFENIKFMIDKEKDLNPYGEKLSESQLMELVNQEMKLFDDKLIKIRNILSSVINKEKYPSEEESKHIKSQLKSNLKKIKDSYSEYIHAVHLARLKSRGLKKTEINETAEQKAILKEKIKLNRELETLLTGTPNVKAAEKYYIDKQFHLSTEQFNEEMKTEKVEEQSFKDLFEDKDEFMEAKEACLEAKRNVDGRIQKNIKFFADSFGLTTYDMHSHFKKLKTTIENLKIKTADEIDFKMREPGEPLKSQLQKHMMEIKGLQSNLTLCQNAIKDLQRINQNINEYEHKTKVDINEIAANQKEIQSKEIKTIKLKEEIDNEYDLINNKIEEYFNEMKRTLTDTINGHRTDLKKELEKEIISLEQFFCKDNKDVATKHDVKEELKKTTTVGAK